MTRRLAGLVGVVVVACAIVASTAQTQIVRGVYPLMDAAGMFFGGAAATVDGTLTTSTASVCTGADTTEDTLWTYTLPANALNADGRGLRVTVYGSTAANTDTKTVRLYFAGSVIRTVLNTTSNNETFYASAVILRSGTSAQLTAITSGNAGNSFVNKGSTSGDTTTGLIIKLTGQNGTAAANDICGYLAVVETLK